VGCVGRDVAYSAPAAIDVEHGWAYALPVRRTHRYNLHIAQTVPQRCSDPLLAMAWPPQWSPSVQAMLSAVLRAGREPTAGLSHLSTPDSILMSYQKLGRVLSPQAEVSTCCYPAWMLDVRILIRASRLNAAPAEKMAWLGFLPSPTSLAAHLVGACIAS
jgi:hypothetical protein